MNDFVSQVPLVFATGVPSVFFPCAMPLMPADRSLVPGVSLEQMEAGAHDAELGRRMIRGEQVLQ